MRTEGAATGMTTSHGTEPQDGPSNRNDLAARLEAALTESKRRRDEQKGDRRRRVRDSGLSIVRDSKIFLLIISLAALKFARWAGTHPGPATAIGALGATALAIVVAVALTNLAPHHPQPHAAPPHSTPLPVPSTSRPPTTTAPSPTNSPPVSPSPSNTGPMDAAMGPPTTSPPETPSPTPSPTAPISTEPEPEPGPARRCLINLDGSVTLLELEASVRLGLCETNVT